MIDFVIPCHPKDFPSLKLSVNGIKNISCANRTFVVSDEDPNIEGVIHVPEQYYAPFINREKIVEKFSIYAPHLLYRTKWVYQQFLKLYAFKVIPELTKSYVLVDSDTIFLRDIQFDPEKFYFCKAQEYHLPYIEPIKQLLGVHETIGFSTICHHMIFNKEKMKQMHSFIENRFNANSLFEAVLSILDYTEGSCMSEWDIYANYILLNHHEFADHRQLMWDNIPFIPVQSDLDEFKNKFDFVSCHAYSRGIE